MSSAKRGKAIRRAPKSRPRPQAGRASWPGRGSTEDRWANMISRAKDDIQLGKRNELCPRFLSMEACWQRAVYAFTLANIRSEADSYSLRRYAEEVILTKDGSRLPSSPTFEKNPFHWVLSALAASREWEIGRGSIFRSGRQLLYAKRHHVPEEFLVGFLHQAGTPTEVERKAGAEVSEIWRDKWIEKASRLA